MKMLNAEDKYQPELVKTGDGSHTLFIPALEEHYHSFHSSVREALHVYVGNGLLAQAKSGIDRIRIFELGFGTGLNVLVTALAAPDLQQRIEYTSIELYPVDLEKCMRLNYCDHLIASDAKMRFESIHKAPWSQWHELAPAFHLYKFQENFLSWNPKPNSYDLIYFDAFGFRAQEEMWQQEVFDKCFRMLDWGGMLLTYASKGEVRRRMLASGFEVEKLPGPPGKREMVRATKKNI